MTGSTPARRRAARDNGRLGGRPRLFANGMRRVSAAIPEDDARLIDLLAVRTGRSVSRVIAEAVWTSLAADGFAPTWGVPDADRSEVVSAVQDRAAASVDDGTDHPGDPSELRHPAPDRAVLRGPGWGACKG